MIIEISDFCPLLGFVYGVDKYKLLMMKCLACGKFVRKCWKSWYCPHCQISWMPNVSTDTIKEAEKLLEQCKQIEKLSRPNPYEEDFSMDKIW